MRYMDLIQPRANVLVTGGAGYVGSVLIPELIKNGFHVRCLDRFFFGIEYLSNKQFEGNLELVRDDIRWFDPKLLDNVDIVIDLAALSNDPVGELDQNKTYDINYLGRSRVARLSKKGGVRQYILASSASNYGQQKDIVDEDSEVFPLTTYSKANRMAEMDVLPLNDDDFTVTVLRFSSIYGVSPRMRFDLAVNNMTLDLYKTGKIVVSGDGKQWRPFLHMLDAIRAYLLVMDAPKRKIGGQIFNVGSDDQNYQIHKLAIAVGDAIGKKYDIEFKGTYDHRSYIASFKKIREKLGFVPKFGVKDGAVEIYKALETGNLTDSIKTKTIEWYKYLLSSDKLLKEISIRNTVL